MTALDFNALPAPPVGQTGWPWEPVGVRPQSNQDAPDCPRISVTIPNLNQGEFLEAAIRSILVQGYPDIELIVMDGGSTDKSVEILRHYAPWISYWESTSDRGQSHAINKGMARATGDLLAWLNADDLYQPGALQAVAEAWKRSQASVVSGHTRFIGSQGQDEGLFRATPVNAFDLLRVRGFSPPQQSTFWTPACWGRHGPLSEDLHYTMDQEFWLRMAVGGESWCLLDRELACLRHHPSQKTARLSENLTPLAERRQFLMRFMQSAYATPAWQREARRGLDAIGVKEWKLRQRASTSRGQFLLNWLRAPLTDWRCLRVRAHYGALRALWLQR